MTDAELFAGSPTKTDGPTSVTDTVRYELGKIVSTFEECRGEVRWRNRVLEQLWTIRGVGMTGAVETVTYEWRPVPEAAP